MKQNSQKGLVVILVLVFAAAFGLSVSALMSFIFAQAKLGAAKEVREKAFNIAEAGLEQYHWMLAHNLGDLEDDPYVQTYTDPEGGDLGTFSLDVDTNTVCGDIQSVDIESTGASNIDTRFTRTLFGRYATPSVAEYAFIIGDSVWAGADREITGPYHSNGAVRMDGTNNSIVTSGLSTWTCDAGTFGCTTTQTVGGVFGDGENSNLWQYPVSTISFDDISANFSTLKTRAITDGIYLEPYSSTEINYSGYDTAVNGYHLIFNSDGTVDIYQVTNVTGFWGWRSGIGSTPDFHIITGESFIERRTVPTDCSLIFVEDKVWIEGTINGKVTVVAADLVNDDYDPDVIIEDDIDYASQDGTDGLTVISEFAILIPPLSPNNLSIKGIFVAQGDRFGRALYTDDTKTQLTIHGTVVSKERVGTAWECDGSFCSGYRYNDNTYDNLQAENPPPFTPSYSNLGKYILWQER